MLYASGSAVFGPGQRYYKAENGIRLAVLWISMPLTVLLVGILKRRADAATASSEQRLTKQIRDQVRDLSLLHEVSRALRFGLGVHDIPQYLCAILVERVGVRRATFGERPAGDEQSDPSARAISNAKPIIVEDIRSDPAAAAWRDWARDASCHCTSGAAFPLIGADQVLAVLNCCADAGFFTEERAALIQSLANLAAIALSEARATEAIRRHIEDLELAMEAGRMGAFDWDIVNERVTWESRHARMFGVRPEAFDGTYESFARCVHPDDLPHIERAVEAARQSRGLYEQEHRVIWPDGSIHWIAGRGRFIYDDAGQPIRMYGVVMDIDRRRAIEETARRQHGQLAHLLRLNLLSQLASGLAHEITQPLAAISNFAGAGLQLGRDNKLTPDAASAMLNEIHQQAHRAGEIVRRLRGFMRNRAPEVSACDLNALVDDALVFTRPELERTGVTARLFPAVDLPAVRADGVQLQQVLVNLIQNAVDAMEGLGEGERVLTLTTAVVDDHVIVRVSDTGKGIAAADLPRVFDSFFSTKDAGLGMGLNISRSIVESHGGQLTAYNNPGGGATFEFALPLDGDPIL